MAGIVIVTGPPGAGKTTLCERLASVNPAGVHIESDAFYRFVAHLISPITAESDAQNRTVIRAVLRAASTFAHGGYEVWLDGIFGPWILPLVAEELEPAALAVDYVILRVDADVALRRATTRGEHPAPAEIARHMHREFERVRDARHFQDVGCLTPDALGEEILLKRVRGTFRLDFPRIVPHTEP